MEKELLETIQCSSDVRFSFVILAGADVILCFIYSAS